MANGCITTSQDQFCCSVCLDLLKDPVTIPCGHNFCMVCINGCWDQEDVKNVFSCPQCRETFTPRPVLCRNNMLVEVVEKLKETELQAASPVHGYSGPGDVECDSCTGRKLKAVKSCLVCLASFCEDHLQPHYQSPAFKKHKLVEACAELQEKICSEHDKLMEIFCRTDQSFICYLCMMEEHKRHDTVSTKAERTQIEYELKEDQMKDNQELQEKQKKRQELEQTVDTIKAAVDDIEKIFNDLISSMEKKRSEVMELIKAQEEGDLREIKRLLNQLQSEIDQLQKTVTEREELLQTPDDIHFLQSFPSLCVSPGCDVSPSFTINQHLSIDGVRKSLSDLKKRVEQICDEEFKKICAEDAAFQMISPSKPKSREDFLQYFCYLTLDSKTAHPQLILSQGNRAVTRRLKDQRYSDHPERFDSWTQVLCKQSLRGRCYWEVDWTGMGVDISVSLKNIKRKGRRNQCLFGRNRQSWSLQCFSFSHCFWHKRDKTELQGLAPSRIGVYLDRSAGTLSFYKVSDEMRLLHTVQIRSTKPLYAGFRICYLYATLKLRDSV